MAKANKSIDLLNLLRGGKTQGIGIYIVEADTANTLVFEGSSTPLDLDLFEIPANYLPVEKGARYFVLPILNEGISQRWGILQRIDQKGVTGTYSVNNGTSTNSYKMKNGIITEIS